MARNGFIQNLVEFVGELGASAILSSHLLEDVARACDHLVVLADARVQVAGDVRDLLADHYRLVGPASALDRLPTGVQVIHAERTISRTRVLVRAAGQLPGAPWTAERVELEELVLGYLNRAAGAPAPERVAA